MSSVDEVLTPVSSNRLPHGSLTGLPAQEGRARGAALEPVALMRQLPVVEAQAGLQGMLQLPDAPVVRAPKSDASQLGMLITRGRTKGP